MENTELLRKIYLFKDFTAMEILQFNKVVTSHQIPAGDVIISKDEKSDTLYILKSGKVEVYLEYEDHSVHLSTLTPVEHFGEMAIVDDAPRSASVKAVENSHILTIKRKDLTKILDSNPECAAKFYQALASSMAKRLRKSNEAIFQARKSLGNIIPPQ